MILLGHGQPTGAQQPEGSRAISGGVRLEEALGSLAALNLAAGEPCLPGGSDQLQPGLRVVQLGPVERQTEVVKLLNQRVYLSVRAAERAV